MIFVIHVAFTLQMHFFRLLNAIVVVTKLYSNLPFSIKQRASIGYRCKAGLKPAFGFIRWLSLFHGPAFCLQFH